MNLSTEGDSPSEMFQDIGASSEDAILIKMLGPSMKISFDWEIMQEDTSVVSGAGGSVTTPVDQYKYLYNTLMSKGVSQILDDYTLTLDFGGGVTVVQPGVVTKITATMVSDRPLTFHAHIDFQVGNVV